MNNSKEKNGITLIALIITIIVLLILAGVSISMVVGDNGILTQAVNASVATDVADTKEQIEVALVGYYDENGEYSKSNVASAVQDVLGDDTSITENEDGTYTVTTEKGNVVDITDLINGASGKEPISKTDPFVGYYADVDGNGTVDGIIYADLLFEENGTWYNTSYSYDVISSDSCKDYYISETDYDKYSESYGTNDVIRVVSGSTGEDRFYVMALEDFSSDGYTSFYWYYAAYGLLDKIVSESDNDFGKGKENTDYVMAKWNDEEFPWGEHNNGNSPDIWGAIEDKYNAGWFVPSMSELSCFYAVFGIGSNDYSKFGLSGNYWSSSQYSSSDVYFIYSNYISHGYSGWNGVHSVARLRLSIIF